MHNTIIWNERGIVLDYGFYGLMGQPVRLQWRRDRIAHFLDSYDDIRDAKVHDDLQKDLVEEW
jgi:hypothetical protein